MPEFRLGTVVTRRLLVTGLSILLVGAGSTALGVSSSAAPQPQVVPMAEQGPVKDPKWPKRIGWKGCPAPRWPAALGTGEPGQGRRVLIIGDSLTRDSRKDTISLLRASGWTPTVRCWGGKRLDWASAQVARAKKLNQLPGVVVIAIGTNDMRWIARSVTQQRVERLLDQIGPKRQVLWVNTLASPGGGDRFNRSKQRWFNRMLERVATKHKNLRVLDWASFGLEQDVRFANALHLNDRGNRIRAEFVTEQVNALAE
jgi:lysophospholipase L1-like esterase